MRNWGVDHCLRNVPEEFNTGQIAGPICGNFFTEEGVYNYMLVICLL